MGKLSVGRSVTFPVFLKALLQGHPDTPLCKKSRLRDDWLFQKEQPAFMNICGYYLTTSSNNYLAPLVFPPQLQAFRLYFLSHLYRDLLPSFHLSFIYKLGDFAD